jgi:transcriptional regulator with XRE-family HTH domain
MTTGALAARILSALKQQGLTRQEMATLTGAPVRLLSAVLSGRRTIPPARATAVIERFSRPQYVRGLEVLDRVRDGVPLAVAVREAHTTVANVRKHVGSALRKTPAGEWRARASDRLPRIMTTLLEDGEARVVVTSSKQASVLSRYAHAIRRVRQPRRPGDRPDLKPFARHTVTTVDGRRAHLVTVEATILRLSDAGEFVDLDDIYG